LAVEHDRLEVVGPDATVGATASDGSWWIDPTDLVALCGWESKDVGLCRGDECVPTRHVEGLRRDDRLDLGVVARLLGAPLVVDEAEGVAALGVAATHRNREIAGGSAPQVLLPDLDGQERPVLGEGGRKQMVVAFSSWCGCRYDLPGWQQMADELGPHGFDVVAVAVDETADDVRPWADGVRFPVLLDPDRRFCDAYGVVNVPTVVWVDEDRRVVQPNLQAFSDDQFVEFHGKASAPHAAALRDWVIDGRVPIDDDDRDDLLPRTSEEAQLARTEFRLSQVLRRRGRAEAADAHLARAEELAPDDFTIWRAGLLLSGGDPFGEAFFERYDAWKERSGGHSYAADRAGTVDDPPLP
jgi:peroxiredoxin